VAASITARPLSRGVLHLVCESATLNDRGFRTKGYSSRRGKTHPPKRFWYTSMRWLLCNPSYIAKKEVNKKKRPLDQSRLPESQRYRIVDANWPPIVSKETFDKVQLLLGENLRSGHNRADTKKHVYLLQGLVTCGDVAATWRDAQGPDGSASATTSMSARTRIAASASPRRNCLRL
jgi:Recombinase